MEQHIRIPTQSKIQTTLQDTVKVKELELINVNTKEFDSINDKKDVTNIDALTQPLVENEDRNLQRKLSVLLIKTKSGIMLKELATTIKSI